jgi:ribonuclease HI
MIRRISKPVGKLLFPFTRVAGHTTHPPLILATVQTDGSYTPTTGDARVAAILTPTKTHNTFRHVQSISAESSTEAEWASISMGLELAITHSEGAVGIENDCLGVINTLISPHDTWLRHEYARYWRYRILRQAKGFEWFGIRWIPREQNRADDLFKVANQKTHS